MGPAPLGRRVHHHEPTRCRHGASSASLASDRPCGGRPRLARPALQQLGELLARPSQTRRAPPGNLDEGDRACGLTRRRPGRSRRGARELRPVASVGQPFECHGLHWIEPDLGPFFVLDYRSNRHQLGAQRVQNEPRLRSDRGRGGFSRARAAIRRDMSSSAARFSPGRMRASVRNTGTSAPNSSNRAMRSPPAPIRWASVRPANASSRASRSRPNLACRRAERHATRMM